MEHKKYYETVIFQLRESVEKANNVIKELERAVEKSCVEIGASKIPHKCPVCNGTGKVSTPPNIASDYGYWASSGTVLFTCVACFGTGIIWGIQ